MDKISIRVFPFALFRDAIEEEDIADEFEDVNATKN